MLFIEPYLVPRDLLRLANVVRREPLTQRLRMAPTRAPRLAPTWAPRGGAGSVAWDDVLAVRIPRAPRIPADFAARLPCTESRAAAADAGARAPARGSAEALAEVADVLGDLLRALRMRRLGRNAAQPEA